MSESLRALAQAKILESFLRLNLVGAVLDEGKPAIDKKVGAVRERGGLARKVQRCTCVADEKSFRTRVL